MGDENDWRGSYKRNAGDEMVRGREEKRDWRSDRRSASIGQKKEVVYEDERRPIDLGRVALPFPIEDLAPPTRENRKYRGYERGEIYNGEHAFRTVYDREKWSRQEYDRGGDRY